MEHTFFPSADDSMWNTEVSCLLPWLDGKGIDIGAGGRSIKPEDIKVDLDPEWKPDILASGDKIPVKDEEFDYLYSIHSLEHFDDQEKTIKEWLRVIKKGGIIACVHPDVDFTLKQLPVEQNYMTSKKPLYVHHHERNQADFMKWIKTKTKLGFEIIDSGVACGNWSFYFILRKL